jgi:putative nucleotidyltransferase with HDIG domain
MLMEHHQSGGSVTLEPSSPSQNTLATASQLHLVETVAVRVLTAAAAARDRGTDDHSQRIVQLAEATTRKLGGSEEEQHLIRLAALLHDIGKIGIPDAILHKPGPLTTEEWTIMRRHPEIGRQILEEAGGIFRPLAAIVAAHHERWDGQGYPAGLAGEEIPLAARILSVVDSYDAMISHRPYRNPFSVKEARAELQRGAGGQYDPCVVEAFLAVLNEQEGWA